MGLWWSGVGWVCVMVLTLLSGMLNSSTNTFRTCACRSAFLAVAAEAAIV